MKASLRRKLSNLAAVAAVVAAAFAAAPPATAGAATGAAGGTSGCTLNSAKGQIQHVIYIQFDNTHFTRDNPNVPSDLEQMPNLLNFIEGNGVLLSNHHTPLISHTATDILTSFTGLYGDRTGVPVANSYRYFNPDGTTNPGVSFAYWTDPIFDPTGHPSDFNFNMLGANGKNTPAPWVPYTRAGCNVGQVATANTVLENIATDIPTVFGPNSPEAAEVKADAPNCVSSAPCQSFSDFVGIGVHCALSSSMCSPANNGKPDLLPDEPGGYNGYMGLFGHKYVAPQIGGSGSNGTNLFDLSGNLIANPKGEVGFPGFDGMAAKVSLSYVAQMQEHGIPITYAYISDAHDAHPSGPAYGPGQAGYVAALKAYDKAFGQFFQRLNNDGINQSNTLFVFTSDEGDHFAGGPPSPAGCDGVNVPCTYSKIGEVSTNLTGLLATQQGITTKFNVHNDDAPTVYINGNPARDAAVTRTFERASGQLTAVNPISGNTDNLTQFLADPVEENILHMVTSDPARTPTFTLFGNPDYFMFHGGTSCSDPKNPCVVESPGFAWNHGDVQPEITNTWLGMVGPGIDHLGVDNSVWSDHTDIRPTIMVLTGLQDDYAHDGRALTEVFDGFARPAATRLNGGYVKVAAMYKQLDASVGQFALVTLMASTNAIESGSATDDSRYASLESQLSTLNTERNTLAGKMIAALEGAEFGGQTITEGQAQDLVSQGQDLLAQANSLLS